MSGLCDCVCEFYLICMYVVCIWFVCVVCVCVVCVCVVCICMRFSVCMCVFAVLDASATISAPF